MACRFLLKAIFLRITLIYQRYAEAFQAFSLFGYKEFCTLLAQCGHAEGRFLGNQSPFCCLSKKPLSGLRRLDHVADADASSRCILDLGAPNHFITEVAAQVL